MVRCFLTGVEVALEDAYVVNRRDSRDFLDALKDRVASLQRVLEQFSPLDAAGDWSAQAGDGVRKFTRKRHRLVCKAVAEVLAPGFPEIRLFLPWPEYHSHARLATLQGMRRHPDYGRAAGELDNETLRQVEKLGMDVLGMLDPRHQLPQETRLAIAVATCVRHRGRPPEEVVELIRATVVEGLDPGATALAPEAYAALRTFLYSSAELAAPGQSETIVLPENESRRRP